MSEETSEKTMALAVGSRLVPTGPGRGAEWLVLGVFVRVLLAVVELLLECLCFLLVGEGQCSQAVLEFEGVEEDAILVVGEGIVYLLVPYDATVRGRYVDQLQPERVANQIIRQHHSALQAGICPPVPVRVGNVQFRDGDGVDLVGRLGDGALHCLFVLVRENRRHCGGFRGLELVMVW